MVPTLDRGLDIDTQHAGVRDEVDVTKFKSQHVGVQRRVIFEVKK